MANDPNALDVAFELPTPTSPRQVFSVAVGFVYPANPIAITATYTWRRRPGGVFPPKMRSGAVAVAPTGGARYVPSFPQLEGHTTWPRAK